MKKGLLFQILALLLVTNCLPAQVSTNFNSKNVVSSRGQFFKDYRQAVDVIIPAKSIDSLLLIERNELTLSNEIKPFRLATPVAIDLGAIQIFAGKEKKVA